ncbi:MAG TPA: hypothetical protein DCS29_02015 [Candidatus Magasanikbacteria bacterium]|nr:MAG: hypothetical protein A2479_00330 [Candidatus Magasanikbacteria bacterium RIFOXYC2_FULL_39_8]HAT03533.1 hypothetical protein [Candidatus Magasanikbacteria bacterium]
MENKKILFSIIIPAYNEEPVIQDCIVSIQSQTGDILYEIIVIDNNSSDHTRDVVGRYAGVKLIQEKKQGVGAARYSGTAIAQGVFVTHLDADTHLPPDYLKKVFDIFEHDANYVCVGGQMFYYDAPWWKNIIRYPVHWGFWFFARIVSRGTVGPMGNNMTFKKEIYDRTSGFDTDLQYGEDMDLCRKLSVYGKVRLDMGLSCHVSIRRFMFNKKLFEYFLNFMKMCLVGKPYKNSLPHSKDI